MRSVEVGLEILKKLYLLYLLIGGKNNLLD